MKRLVVSFLGVKNSGPLVYGVCIWLKSTTTTTTTVPHHASVSDTGLYCSMFLMSYSISHPPTTCRHACDTHVINRTDTPHFKCVCVCVIWCPLEVHRKHRSTKANEKMSEKSRDNFPQVWKWKVEARTSKSIGGPKCVIQFNVIWYWNRPRPIR